MPVFRNDETADKAWKATHLTDGSVLNAVGSRTAQLHRGNCGHLGEGLRRRETTRLKACAVSRDDITGWAAVEGYEIIPCPDCDM